MFQERLKTHHSAMADAKAYALGPRSVGDFLNDAIVESEINDKATIYIHVPFCSKICSFCNMRRSLQKPRETYHELIIKEIKKYSQLEKIKGLKFDAIYFGGGTPTTLTTEALRQILRALKEYLVLTPEVEITIETTVSELSDKKLQMFKEEGVNRFSVGVQTFNDQGRKLMGRVGSGNKAYSKLKQIKEMGFQTVSMDLIYNYPGQTEEDLLEDLQKIDELQLDGFSMYSLIDMKETRISEAQNHEQDNKFFKLISETMNVKGYKFLELTKMVKNDHYKYVMNRHRGADTVPLGAGAGGSIDGLMLMNEINLDQYANGIYEFNMRKGMLFDKSYQALGKFKGSIQSGYLPMDLSLYRNKEEYEEKVDQMLQLGYIEKFEKGYRLTNEGVFWGNNISRMLYDLIKK